MFPGKWGTGRVHVYLDHCGLFGCQHFLPMSPIMRHACGIDRSFEDSNLSGLGGDIRLIGLIISRRIFRTVQIVSMLCGGNFDLVDWNAMCSLWLLFLGVLTSLLYGNFRRMKIGSWMKHVERKSQIRSRDISRDPVFRRRKVCCLVNLLHKCIRCRFNWIVCGKNQVSISRWLYG